MKSILCAAAIVLASVASASAGTYSGSNLGIIVDNSTATHGINVTDTSAITGLTLQVNFSTCDSSFSSTLGACSTSGDNTFDREMTLALTSAEGTVVNLILEDTYLSTNVSTDYLVTFDDSAPTTVGGTPVSGTFAPVEALSALIGENPFGFWSLTIGDTVGADPRRLNGFSLNIGTTIAAVPLPAGLPLLAGALGMFAFLRRRRS